MVQLVDLGMYSIPSWAVISLEYGTNDSLTDEEIEMIDTFLKDLAQQGYSVASFDYATESHFTHHPEFGLPCECYETRIYATTKKAS